MYCVKSIIIAFPTFELLYYLPLPYRTYPLFLNFLCLIAIQKYLELVCSFDHSSLILHLNPLKMHLLDHWELTEHFNNAFYLVLAQRTFLKIDKLQHSGVFLFKIISFEDVGKLTVLKDYMGGLLDERHVETVFVLAVLDDLFVFYVMVDLRVFDALFLH